MLLYTAAEALGSWSGSLARHRNKCLLLLMQALSSVVSALSLSWLVWVRVGLLRSFLILDRSRLGSGWVPVS